MNKRFILLLLSFATIYSADNPTGGGKWGFLKPYIISAAKTAGTIVLTSMLPTDYKPPFARHKTQSATPAKTETPSVKMTNREPIIGGDRAQDQFLKPGEYYDEKTGEIYRKDGRPRNQSGNSAAPSDSVSYTTGTAGGQNVTVGVQKGGILNAVYDGVNYLFGSSAKERSRDQEIEAFNKDMDAKIPKNPSVSPGVVQDAQKLLDKRLNAIPNYTDAELDRRQRLAKSAREADTENPSGVSEVRIDILNKEIAAIQKEKLRRKTVTTVAQATALTLTTTTTGTASTEKTQTVPTAEEQRLHDSIKAREAQVNKWRTSPWPQDWFVTGWHVENYEKETNAEKQKLAEMQKARWEGSLTQLKQHEAEKQKEISKKIIDHRNNNSGGNGGGDKDPEKDPKKGPTLTDATGVYGVKKAKDHLNNPHPESHGSGSNNTASHGSGNSNTQSHTTPTTTTTTPNPKTEKALAEHKVHEAQQFEANQKALKEARKAERAKMNEDTQPFHEKGIEAKFPDNPGQKDHMFRDKSGHIKERTPNSEKMVMDTIEPNSFTHVDKNGNSVYVRDHTDGKQIWAHVRPDGTIKNCGVNETPWKKNPVTGVHERPAGERAKGPGAVYTISAGVVGALATESTQASQLEQFLPQAIIDKIKGDHLNPIVDNRIKNDPNPFQLPPAPESHKPDPYFLPPAPENAKQFSFTTSPEMKAIVDRKVDHLRSLSPQDQMKEIMKPISTPTISIPGGSTSTKIPTLSLLSSTGLSSKSGQSTPSALPSPKTSAPASALSIPTKSGSSSSASKIPSAPAPRPSSSSLSTPRSGGSSTSYRPSTPSSGFGGSKGGGYSSSFGSKRN